MGLMIRVRTLVPAEESLHVRGHRAQRRRFRLTHVLVEVGRPPDGLTRVVDDEVQPLFRRQQLPAERLDARRVAKIEAVDLESVGPLAEIMLASIAGRRIAWKARGDDETCASTKKLDPGLIPDFHAAAGEQCNAATQVRELGALREILVGAGGAKPVVEMMDRREFLLAHVALPRVFSLRNGLAAGEQLLRFRRIDI